MINLVQFEGDHGEIFVNPYHVSFLTQSGKDHTEIHFAGTEDIGIVVHTTLKEAARALQR